MTEYKRLVAVTEDLQKFATPEVLKLRDEDVEGIFAVANEVFETILNSAVRFDKIVAKAREKDPNKIIFNERMCEKIEELRASFVENVQRIYAAFPPEDDTSSSLLEEEGGTLGSLVEWLSVLPDPEWRRNLEMAHGRVVSARVNAKEWQDKVTATISEVTAREMDHRVALGSDERNCFSAAIVDPFRTGRAEVRQLEQRRERMKWKAEEGRRRSEEETIQKRSLEISFESLAKSIPKVCVQHLQVLCSELLMHPENKNVRILRNDHKNVICHFGHPCVVCSGAGEEEEGERGGVYWDVELALYLIGYRIKYSSNPHQDTLLLRKSTVNDENVMEVMITMPDCATSMDTKNKHTHRYIPLGFEDYSERCLQLIEPDPSENPDNWMLWHANLQECHRVLEKTLLH